MKCSKCGKEIANDSVFCEYCGARIKKEERDKIKQYILIAIGIILLSVSVVLGEVYLGTGLLGGLIFSPIFYYIIKHAVKYDTTQNTIETMHVITSNNVTTSIVQAKQERKPQPVEEKTIYKRIVDTEYISNLRIGRSWVLPQMVDMCFEGNRFSKYKYMAAVETLDYDKGWKIMLRNYRVISLFQDKADEYRSLWWTKDVAVAMAKNDLKLLKAYIPEASRYARENCSGGPYIRLDLRGCRNKQEQMYFTGAVAPSSKWYGKGKTMEDLYRIFETYIQEIEHSQTVKQVYNALKYYDEHRCLFTGWSKTPTLPKVFTNAFMGDGAFTSMMTLVKFFNLTYKNETGSSLTREQCIADIEGKAKDFGQNGEKMFAYLTEKYFDTNAGGVFDINNYRKKNR